jgi:hypothetical protein
VAISVLLRAHLWTERTEYLDTARGAFHAFTLSIADGGVSSRDELGYLFFEETVPVQVYHILNGFISSLWGVYEYGLATNDLRARMLFDEGLQALEHYLPEYDVGWASLYSLYHLHSGSRLKDVASLFYQTLHVRQLDVLYRLTGCLTFEKYRQRWESYLRIRTYRVRTLMAKALFKLLRY